MQTIMLGESGRSTTRLGFGCSSLMGSLDRKESLAMLGAAYDAGVRHFDVAPSYGFGEAEGCLGEFINQHPGQITVTTKFGIPTGNKRASLSVARSLARPFLRVLPGLKKNLRRIAGRVAGGTQRTPFTAENARQSLDRSLSALRVDRIDLWLLHEAETDELQDDGLLCMLSDARRDGKIGAHGVGSAASKIESLMEQRAAYCPTLQYEWSVLDALIPPGPSFRLHHRSLTENFRALQGALQADAKRCRRWSDHCGADLGCAETLALLMLKASLVCNPESIVLFSSKHPGHIRKNVSIVGDLAAEEQALRLYALVRSEAVQAMPG